MIIQNQIEGELSFQRHYLYPEYERTCRWIFIWGTLVILSFGLLIFGFVMNCMYGNTLITRLPTNLAMITGSCLFPIMIKYLIQVTKEYDTINETILIDLHV